MGIDRIKDYIIDESSVLRFSSWGDYYDFPCAGEETIKAYVKDINNHRKQVGEFLNLYDDNSIIESYEETEGVRVTERANKVLVELGYKFKEG